MFCYVRRGALKVWISAPTISTSMTTSLILPITMHWISIVLNMITGMILPSATHSHVVGP